MESVELILRFGAHNLLQTLLPLC